MWDSPYQACRSETERISAPAGLAAASAIFNSVMAGPQIGFLHALVPGQFGIIAFGQHLPARQHGDDVGQIGDHGAILSMSSWPMPAIGSSSSIISGSSASVVAISSARLRP